MHIDIADTDLIDYAKAAIRKSWTLGELASELSASFNTPVLIADLRTRYYTLIVSQNDRIGMPAKHALKDWFKAWQ